MREEPDGKPQQKKVVKRLAPLSYDEWLGVVYLHQGGIHDLLAGTPTEKRQYLTSVFGLDFYDDLLTEAKEELKSLNRLVEGAINLQQSLVDLEDDVREQEEILDEVPGGISEVEAGIEKLSKRLQKWAAELGKLDAAESAADRLKELTLEGEALSDSLKVSGRAATEKALKSARAKESKLTQSIAEDEVVLKGMERAAKTYKRTMDAERSAKQKLDSAKEDLDDIAGEVLHHPSLDLLKLAQETVDSAQTLMGEAASIDIPDDVESVKSDWQDLAKEASANAATAAKLEKLAAKKVHVCPTCDTDIEAKALQTSIKTLRRQAKKDRLLAASGVLDEVSGHLGDWEPEVDDLTLGDLGEALDAAVEAVEARDEADAAVESAAEWYKERAADLKALPKPKNPQKLAQAVENAQEELGELDDRITDLSAALDIHKEYEALEKTLDGVDVDTLEEKHAEVTAKAEKTQARYKKAMAIKTRHDHATATIRALSKQIKNVRDKLDEHAQNALKIKHYELTLIPYFNTLRAAKVQSSVSVLEGVLPVYVNAMASSQYAGAEVKLSITDDLKKVELMLRAGKHSPWISAIQASGGQRRRFTLAIIAALREVSPRRANLMFFDEPFADLESEGKLLFINRLVPTLMERCDDLDSLFVIAHDKEILEASNDSFDSVWEAQREVSGSRIVTGQRLALVDGRSGFWQHDTRTRIGLTG
jgi:DNA repair exonuclease SbcCD ATPase subunit